MIEIMISLVLGLILLGGTLQLLITSKSSYRLQDGIGSMQENGRYAIYSVRENILVAGYPGFADIEPFVYKDDGSLTFDGKESDKIAVQYRLRPDCLGNMPVAGSTVINLLFVDKERRTLNCTAININDETGLLVKGKTLPLVDDIEAMQVLYGVDDDEDGVANLYVNATQVAAGVVDSGSSDWERVVSVRIALLARSRESSGVVRQQDYYLLDGGAVEYNDGFARRVFTTTVPLRNRVL